MPKKKRNSSLYERFSFLKKLIVPFFFFVIAAIYFHNVTRDIYSGDIGDLVTAAYVFGVAHPPGYPLFTVLGAFFSHLPLPFPVVTKVAFISTIGSLAGLVIFYRFSKYVTKNVFISLLSTSILAFSYLYWFHAEIPEVFGLNNFFVVSILYTSFLFYKEKKDRYLFTLALLVGLSLTHHHTILFILPGVFLLVIKHFRYIFFNKGRLIRALLCFVAGLSVYAYVPIAASFDPVVNWDEASTLQGFIHLLLRKDYGGFAPGIVNQVPFSVKTIVLGNYTKTIINTFSYQIIFIFLLGLISLMQKDKRLFFSFLLAFILSGPFFAFYAASNYTTNTFMGVIERFYVLSTIIYMFFVPYGFQLLQSFLQRFLTKPYYIYLILGYFVTIPLLQLRYNMEKTDLSQTQIGNRLAENIFRTVPKNGVLLVSGDTTLFNVWYYHYVLGNRPDITLINPTGVGGNKRLNEEINTYHKKNPSVPPREIVRKLFAEQWKNRGIYATYDIPNKPKGTILLPKGMVFQLIPQKDIPEKEAYIKEFEKTWKTITVERRETLSPSDSNLVTTEIPTIYSNGLIRVADYMVSNYQDPAKAEHYYRRALWIDDTNPGGYAGLSLSLFKAYKDCSLSPYYMKMAIDNYIIWKKYYLQLYRLYEECNAPKEKDALVALYNTRFKENLEKVVAEQLKRTPMINDLAPNSPL